MSLIRTPEDALCRWRRHPRSPCSSLPACGSGSGGDAHGGKAPDYARRWRARRSRSRRSTTQADQLLPGRRRRVRARLAELRGHPVVVNKWASWCGPCREEFPWFQRLSARLGKRVAFIGVDSNDSNAAAKDLPERVPGPLSELHRSRPGDRQRRSTRPSAFPRTAFYDPSGKHVYVQQGQYASEAALAADIRRYAR